ncbi:protein FLOURY 1-like isoform X2 [Durio zibethinus]|nr:protein FLOURY 1-like isoform X2 [Durio zibethinus]
MMDFVSFLKLLSPGKEVFGCGFLVFGRFSYVFNVLGLFLMIGMGLKFWQIGLTNKGIMQFLCDVGGKSNDLRGGICSKHDLDEVYDPKIRACRSVSLKLVDNCKELVNGDINGKAKYAVEEDSDEKENECCPEDKEFDVTALRNLVKIEKRRTKAACQELEKERIAAASAADEAMAMILRLQSEKSSMEIEANRYKRMAEQKQEYDQQVIESLQWIVMKHESERSLLEDQLQWCTQKLKLYMRDDELDQFELDAGISLSHATQEDGMQNELVSSTETETETVVL